MSKYRVWYNVLGLKPFKAEVNSPEEAKVAINVLADFANQMVDEGIMPDFCSGAGLEYFDEEEQDWLEWYDEDGLDIMEE